jgi:prevent-host-death family protein
MEDDMETVGSYEAKTHLPTLLARVARGERFTITKHGVPVAVLIPADPARGDETANVIAEMKRLRKGRRLRGVTIGQLIREGRRF